jgi:hypothetical protein
MEDKQLISDSPSTRRANELDNTRASFSKSPLRLTRKDYFKDFMLLIELSGNGK